MSVSVLNTDAGLEGKTITNLEDAQTVTGLKTFDRDPNPPFAVTANSDVVENLVAESVEGGTVDATTGDFSGNVTVGGTLDVTGAVTLSSTSAVTSAGIWNGLTFTPVSNSETGSQNNWSPSGMPTNGNFMIIWAGSSALTVTGIAGGTTGQMIVFKNLGSATVTFSHDATGSSTATNCFRNMATSAGTPVAIGGCIVYQHDGGRWALVSHEQGAWITPTFAAGDYTASSGTWTVDAGDVIECEYRLTGKTLNWTFFVNTTDVSTTPLTLKRIIPGGFTAAQACHLLARVGDGGGSAVVGIAVITAGVATVDFYPTVTASTAWTATSGDNTFIILSASFEVT